MTHALTLEGRTALVTGGTAGIGLAVARRFAAEGAHVFITGRRQDALDAVVAEIGDRATGIRADGADLDDLDRVFATIAERGAGLDVLHANAGGGDFATIEEMTPEGFDRTFATNVRGTAFAVQKAVALMPPGSSIVITGSTAAVKATPSFGVYSATKGALKVFTRVWAVELAAKQIRVNSVVPGPVETPGLAGLADSPENAAALLGALAEKVPLGRLITPDEVADAVLFLASDASRMVTGSDLVIDGGESYR